MRAARFVQFIEKGSEARSISIQHPSRDRICHGIDAPFSPLSRVVDPSRFGVRPREVQRGALA